MFIFIFNFIAFFLFCHFYFSITHMQTIFDFNLIEMSIWKHSERILLCVACVQVFTRRYSIDELNNWTVRARNFSHTEYNLQHNITTTATWNDFFFGFVSVFLMLISYVVPHDYMENVCVCAHVFCDGGRGVRVTCLCLCGENEIQMIWAWASAWYIVPSLPPCFFTNSLVFPFSFSLTHTVNGLASTCMGKISIRIHFSHTNSFTCTDRAHMLQYRYMPLYFNNRTSSAFPYLYHNHFILLNFTIYVCVTYIVYACVFIWSV